METPPPPAENPNHAPMTEAERAAFLSALLRGAEIVGVSLTPEQADLCLRFADLVRVGNSRTNLTRIIAPRDMAIKHFVDSVTVFAALPQGITPGATLLDVGTGAGFPGVVLSILRPDLRITLLDSLNKRLVFLRDALETLQRTENVTLWHARAEDAGRTPDARDTYDVVVARAVAALPTLLEWCGPMVRVGGQFVAMKSGNVDAEKTAANRAESILGLRLIKDAAFTLPAVLGDNENTETNADASARRVLVYRKLRPTPPAFPRKSADIKNKPL